MATASARCPAPRILFVDDDPNLRQLGAMVLTQQGYDVRCAANGVEGLQSLGEGPLPHLVISDLRMPKMSGFEFLSIVRHKYPAMPLIAISGEFVTQSDVIGIADAFFPKGGYTPAQLSAKIDELLAHPPSRREMSKPPIWVPVNSAGQVVITCTECLRSIAVRVCPPALGNPCREVECMSCGAQLKYCVDEARLKDNHEWDCSALRVVR